MKLAHHQTYSGTGNAFSRVLCVLQDQIFPEKPLSQNDQPGRPSRGKIKKNTPEKSTSSFLGHQKILYICPSDDEALAALRYFRALAPISVTPLTTAKDFFGFLAAPQGIWVATTELFFKKIPTDRHIAQHLAFIKPGDKISRDALSERLSDAGYRFSRDNIPGTYRTDGDTITVWPNYGDRGWRVSFLDDSVELVISFPAEDELNLQVEKRLALPGATNIPDWNSTDFSPDICRHFSDTFVWLSGLDFFQEISQIQEKIPHWIHLSDMSQEGRQDLGIHEARIADLGILRQELTQLATEKNTLPPASRAIFYTKNTAAVQRFLDDNRLPDFLILPLTVPGKGVKNHSEASSGGIPLRGQSFRTPEKLVLCDDLIGPLFVRTRTRRSAAASADLLLQIRPGDHVVHLHHGVGIFDRIVGKELSGVAREYLEIRYAAEDRLFVPIEEADRLSKYIGKENPDLHRLGGEQWKKALAQAQDEAARIAQEMLASHAQRQLTRAVPLLPYSEKEALFRVAFPYPHTADQETSAAEILADLEKDEPMERLLSGDVGFGKTEVAMHAIYRAFLNGAQSMILSPLLVLAHEHGDTLKKRLQPFGVRIEVLSRLTPDKEEKRILKEAAAGKVDVLVGTHRLLSPDVALPRLALLIIDEEHRFGVADKEKIATRSAGIHLLSMSATPIPRSLHLAMSGVRKMSVIAMAPWGRLPVQTLITPETDDALARSLLRELERGGQSFVLSNRVETMLPMRDRIARLLPKKTRIAVAHGQMSALQLEDTILAFKRREFDILLCSTVVENGVNFLDANTMVVLDADRFGLSQLHQLRGRVGRGKTQGYCHLMYRREKLTDDARQRLSTMASLTHLGAGFEIALRDLEIRGAGEMLGLSQSGKTKEVGVGLYLRLLEDRVRQLRGQSPRKTNDCQIDAAVSWKVPDEFFDGDTDKVHFFRTLESVADEKELDEAWENLLDGRAAPPEAVNLMLALKARIRLSAMGIRKVAKSGGFWQFEFAPSAGTEGLRAFLKADHRGLAILSEARARIPLSAFLNDRAMLTYWTGT